MNNRASAVMRSQFRRCRWLRRLKACLHAPIIFRRKASSRRVLPGTW